MIYAGKETAVLGLVDVSRIIAEMSELLKVSLSKRAVLEADLGQNLPPILASAAQIRQIVLNLVTNASDAIGERGGVIRVTTRCVRADETRGGWFDRLRSTAVGGLRHRARHAARNPSQSVRPVLHHEIRGPRPRACVVYGIVRNLGGTIGIASEPDKGATIQILLPSAKTTSRTSSEAISGIGEIASSALAPLFWWWKMKRSCERLSPRFFARPGSRCWRLPMGFPQSNYLV